MLEVKESLAGELNNGQAKGTINVYPPIINLKVTPSKETQVHTHEDSYGYDKVFVDPIPNEYIIPSLEAKVITPMKEAQTVEASDGYDGLSRVTVNGVTKDIDNNIQPSNIKNGVSILGVIGTLQGGSSASVAIVEGSTLILSSGNVEGSELTL